MAAPTYPKALQKWMITLTIMLVAMIEVLDMTIVNVALPPMMGDLGTSSDKITWVLTSYIVTSAIFMLLTGFLDSKFGRRRLLLICITGFMITSALCGLSTSLEEIVFFRALQGVFGASLVPLSQTILRTTFPPKEQGKAMAIWGIGIMVAPVFGPTVGGYITEYFSWRWVFYINVPVCILSFFMAMQFIKDNEKTHSYLDLFGAVLMGVGVGSFQIFLDQGNNHNWFESKFIDSLAVICFFSLSAFIIRGINNANNIINFKLFLDRNFVISTLMLTIFSMGVLGIIAIQPILLENYFGYPTELTGLVMAPRAIAAAIGMMITGMLINILDARKIMFIGLFSMIIGSYMMSQYNLQTDPAHWLWSGAIQGLGIGLFMVPLSTLSLSTLPQSQMATGAGFFSFGRNIGSSIGISILSAIITRETQINWNRLGENINPYNENLLLWLKHQSWQINNPLALNHLQFILAKQAGMIAFIDSFWITSLSLIALLPFLFFLKKHHLFYTKTIVH